METDRTTKLVVAIMSAGGVDMDPMGIDSIIQLWCECTTSTPEYYAHTY